jgi:hypothetical protein
MKFEDLNLFRVQFKSPPEIIRDQAKGIDSFIVQKPVQ